MDDPIKSAVAGIIYGAFQVWANHTGKPKGWIPTAQDVQDFLLEIDEYSPEARKEAARKRLGIA